MNNDWSDTEITEIIKDYFEMLSFEIRQINYNKSSHRKRLKEKLSHRSEASIEFKHANISAVLIKYGRPYIIGYKPRSNYQKNLELALLKNLESEIWIENDFDFFASNGEINNVKEIDFNKWVEDVPKLTKIEEDVIEYKPRISKVNFLEKEQHNRSLGLLGEELVINYEQWRLIEKGKAFLSDKIEWVSKDYGDGAGYDILSKNIDGTDRYIEVKTTKLGKLTPIYLTKNELNFSKKNERNYYLYRVFEFNRKPKMFNSIGSLDNICRLEPINYLGKFK